MSEANKKRRPCCIASRSLKKLENHEKEFRLWRNDASTFSVFYAFSDSHLIHTDSRDTFEHITTCYENKK